MHLEALSGYHDFKVGAASIRFVNLARVHFVRFSIDEEAIASACDDLSFRICRKRGKLAPADLQCLTVYCDFALLAFFPCIDGVCLVVSGGNIGHKRTSPKSVSTLIVSCLHIPPYVLKILTLL